MIATYTLSGLQKVTWKDAVEFLPWISSLRIWATKGCSCEHSDLRKNRYLRRRLICLHGFASQSPINDLNLTRREVFAGALELEHTDLGCPAACLLHDIAYGTDDDGRRCRRNRSSHN
jgi:hypothetical protein